MNPNPLVLVVEDEPSLQRFLHAALTSHGFRVLQAASQREALALATSHNPEAILLDLGLPDGDGFAFLQQVRGWSAVPVLVVSARGQEADKIHALDHGADDYITKPFSTGELLARLRVALRRVTAPNPREPELRFDGLVVDLALRTVSREGTEIHLTPTEFRLLAVLARHADRVVTHRQLLREVWGPNHGEHVHYVRVYMAELRRKLELDPARPRWLLTETGVGYRLRPGS
jgi:two-component system KDP operon response regulator KdpE